MDYDYVIGYLGKTVKLILTNNYFYIGKILDVKPDSLLILDKTGKNVSIGLNSIMLLEESNGY